MFWAANVLGVLNLGLLLFVFVETRRTRTISQQLASIESNRDRAVLAFDVASESKGFRATEQDMRIFVRVLNRGG
jgi:hypothetical protein